MGFVPDEVMTAPPARKGFVPDAPDASDFVESGGKPAVRQPYSPAAEMTPGPSKDWLPSESGSIGFSNQVLYDMAPNDDVRRRILEKSFGPEAVKQDTEGFYVVQDGKRLRPGGGRGAWEGLKRGTAGAVASALPTVGAIGGAATGAPAGPAGAVAGAGVGYAAGEAANESLLTLAGYPTERTLMESTGHTLKNVATGGALEAGGGVLGAIAGAIPAGAKLGYETGVKPALQSIGRYVAGMSPDVAKQVLPLATEGVRVPPEIWAPEAPIMRRVMQASRAYGLDPVTPTVEKYAEKKVGQTLEDLGVPKEEIGPVTRRTAAVDYAPAGEAVHRKYAQMLAESDARLNSAMSAFEESQRGLGAAAEATRAESLAAARKAMDENRTAAQKVVDATWKDIQSATTALKSGVPQENPGDLVRATAEKVVGLRQALGERYRKLYGDIDKMTGSASIDTTTARIGPEDETFHDATAKFMELLPEEIRNNHPALFRALHDVEETGELTFGQAHHLRSMLGDLANWDTLAPSFKNGQYKYFRGLLDDLLHAPNNPKLIRDAVEELDKVDAGYRSDFAKFNDKTIQGITNWTRSNLPPSAEKFAQGVLQPGMEETRGAVRSIAGPKIWDAIIGADMQAALDASKSLVPGQYDGGAFVKEFLRRDRDGLLADYPKATADLMRKQAQYVQAIAGDNKLDLNLLAEDSFTVAMRKAADAAAEVERLSKDKPMETFEAAIKKAKADHAAALAAGAESRVNDPLDALLSNRSAKVARSAQEITRHSELLEAAADKFGKDSPEFQLLRQTWLRDVLTTSDNAGLREMHGKVIGLTPAQQELYFGTKAEDVILVTRQLRDLLTHAEDFGGSLFAAGTVTHPESVPVPGAKQLIPKAAPGFVKRLTAGPMLKIASNMVTSPGLVKFLASAMRGNEEEQLLAKKIIADYARRGGYAGIIAGSALANGAPQQPPPAGPEVDWRAEMGATRE